MRCRSAGLWYGEPKAISNAIGYAMHYSRSHDAVIRVYDDTSNVIETRTRGCAVRVLHQEQAIDCANGPRFYQPRLWPKLLIQL
jgi:hypothetical protein